MATSTWTRTLEGKGRRLVRAGRILYFYHQNSDGASRLTALDVDGELLWSRDDLGVPYRVCEEFTLCVGGGRPTVLRADGSIANEETGRFDRPEYTWTGSPTVVDEGDSFVFTCDDRVFRTSKSLEDIREFRPPDRVPTSDFVADRFYWNENDTVFVCEIGGEPRRLVSIPDSLVEQAMTQFELDTGSPALGFLMISQPDESMEDVPGYIPPSREGGLALTPTLMGQRFRQELFWVLGSDPRGRRLFMAVGSQPHVVVGLDPHGDLLWARQLSSVCCGGTPLALDNGTYIVNSSCDGVLTWIDADGEILARATPRRGMLGDMATRDSWTWVSVDYGVAVFDGEGKPVWDLTELVSQDLKPWALCMDLDVSARRIFWATDMEDTVTVNAVDLGE